MNWFFLIFSILCFRSISEQTVLEIKGVVTEATNNKPLPYANIRLVGKSIGTIANEQGGFLLKITPENKRDTLCISYLGYQSFKVPVNEISIELNIHLQILSKSLNPVIVSGNSSAVDILKSAIKLIPQNYPANNLWLQAFYRQMETEDTDTTVFEEAVVNISSKGYGSNKKTSDSVELIKGHIYIEVPSITPHLNQIQVLFQKDHIKWKSSILDTEQLQYYDFTFEVVSEYNGHEVYVISFDQKDDVDRALYKGIIYIDRFSLAIIKYEYTISPKGMPYWRFPWAFRVLEKRVLGAEDDWQQYTVSVSYEELNGKWYLKDLHYFRKINRIFPKKGYACLYTWKLDAVVTKTDTSSPQRPVDKTKYLSRARPLSRQAGAYDSTFWENYNIIR